MADVQEMVTGQDLKAWRVVYGRTQAETGAMIGMSKWQICRLERSNQALPVAQALLLVLLRYPAVQKVVTDYLKIAPLQKRAIPTVGK